MPRQKAAAQTSTNKEAKISNSVASKVSPSVMLTKLHIGALVQVSSTDASLKYLTRLIGVDGSKTLITALPTPKQMKKESVSVVYDDLFFAEKKLIMRLVAQGSVFAFESEVTAVNYSGCKLLLSSFPKLIQSQVLRRDARFPCALTASCEYQGAQFKAVIVDISNGGCQMYLDSSDLALEIDEIKSQDMLLRIRLPVDEAVENINSTVMSVQKVKGHELSLGLAFKQPEKSINDYINSLQLGDMSALFL